MQMTKGQAMKLAQAAVSKPTYHSVECWAFTTPSGALVRFGSQREAVDVP